MPRTFTLARTAPARAELVAIAVTTEALADRRGELDWDLLASRGFEASPGQAETLTTARGLVLAVGAGKQADVSVGRLRQCAVAVARGAGRHRSIAVDFTDARGDAVDPIDAVQAMAEGIELGAYEFLGHKSDPKPSELRRVTIVGPTGVKAKDALARGEAIAAGVALARDLVNEPGGSLTPVAFARRVTSLARAKKLTVQVMDLAAIRKARLGGLLGVNRGSEQQPRFVTLRYRPKGASRGSLAFVGKGITFDAGGLSIKTAQGMMTMKCDMAGAAAVVGAMAAIAEVAPPVEVTAYLPMTDNMLGGDATRPGDVLTIRNGKTVEVLNTDAEGRLVLADALSLAGEAEHDAIIDLATLTGAAMAALGPQYAAVMGNDDAWVSQVLEAGERTGERLWRLPLAPEYRSMLDSTVADIKNIGGPLAGAITAALFLQEFVPEGTAWAHIDLAGPSFTDTPFDEHPKGGTGFGVRSLVSLAESFEALAS
ncbi:MAG: leucyl aminopeptidase [Acidimicrobiales bacterium]